MNAKPNSDLIPVTFVFPVSAGAQTVAIAGDFNDWSVDQHPLQRNGDENFSITIELPAGRRYQYRYLVDGQEWENDWNADAYVPNEYGGNNSQLDLTENSPRLAAATIAPSPDPVPAPAAASEDPGADAGASTKPKTKPKPKKAAPQKA